MTNKEYPYLYLGSVSEARRYNELDQWRESHRENIACKNAIEEAIQNRFDGMYLDEACAKTVIEAYGFKRVGKVLVMSPYTLKESYWAQENQLWLATGGFGCSPTAAGRAVFAVCLGDGEQTRWNREDFIGVLREEHLPEWAREKLEQLTGQTQKQTAPVVGEMEMS